MCTLFLSYLHKCSVKRSESYRLAFPFSFLCKVYHISVCLKTKSTPSYRIMETVSHNPWLHALLHRCRCWNAFFPLSKKNSHNPRVLSLLLKGKDKKLILQFFFPRESSKVYSSGLLGFILI